MGLLLIPVWELLDVYLSLTLAFTILKIAAMGADRTVWNNGPWPNSTGIFTNIDTSYKCLS